MCGETKNKIEGVPLWWRLEYAEQGAQSKSPIAQKMLKWCRGTWADKNWPGAFLHGPLQVGKTSTAIYAAHVATTLGFTAEFMTVLDLVSIFKESWGPRAVCTEQEAIARLCKPSVLIVDEVGVQFETETERNILYWVLVRRFNQCKPTIVTTNLNMDTKEGKAEFQKCVGDRVAARFKGERYSFWGA